MKSLPGINAGIFNRRVVGEYGSPVRSGGVRKVPGRVANYNCAIASSKAAKSSFVNAISFGTSTTRP